MTNTLIILLSTLGSIFVLIAACGLLRMPDFYLRLSVTVKAATLGIGCLLVAAAIYFNEFSVTTKVFAIIFFIFITAPVAGHMIARTAYYTGIKLWKGSLIDELKGKYNKKTNKLISEISVENNEDSTSEINNNSNESPSSFSEETKM